MSSREKRAQVIQLLQENAVNHPESFSFYITACLVSWYFKDSPTGMATVDQVKVFNLVHEYVSFLDHNFETEELSAAHQVMHDLQTELIEKLKSKGIISADDHGFIDDDALLEKHAPDFSAWAEELNTEEGK